MKIKLLVLILVSLFAVNAQAVTPYDYVCPEEDYKCESEQINKITQYLFTEYLNEKIPEYAKPSEIAREEAERNRMRDEAKAQNGIRDEVEANRARKEAEAERNRMRDEAKYRK